MLAIDCREIKKWKKMTGLGRILVSVLKSLNKFDIEFECIGDETTDFSLIRKINPKSKFKKIPKSNFILDQIIIPAITKSKIFFSIYPKFPILLKSKIYILVADLIDEKVKTFLKITKRKEKTIFTISEYWKKEIEKITNRVIRVYPDISYLPKIEKKSEDFILYVGNFNPHKNVRRLILAYKMLQEDEGEKNIPPLYLIGGGGKKEEDIEKIIEDLKVKNVKIKKDVKDNEIFNLYSSSSIFVFPSLAEGFGLPPLEASFFKTPPLVSSIPIMKEIFQIDEIFFDPYSPKMIKTKIKEFLDKELRDFIRERVYRIAEKFHNHNAGEEIIKEIIKSI